MIRVMELAGTPPTGVTVTLRNIAEGVYDGR
jgi:hypothetical protein